jgi:hypothetical protein
MQMSEKNEEDPFTAAVRNLQALMLDLDYESMDIDEWEDQVDAQLLALLDVKDKVKLIYQKNRYVKKLVPITHKKVDEYAEQKNLESHISPVIGENFNVEHYVDESLFILCQIYEQTAPRFKFFAILAAQPNLPHGYSSMSKGEREKFLEINQKYFYLDLTSEHKKHVPLT